jgi:hypothetical protein
MIVYLLEAGSPETPSVLGVYLDWPLAFKAASDWASGSSNLTDWTRSFNSDIKDAVFARDTWYIGPVMVTILTMDTDRSVL